MKAETSQFIPTHGLSKHPLFYTWQAMRARCTNPNNTRFKHYGGRGISVCEDWQDFAQFYTDMIGSYEKGLALDRIDNDGNYCKQNCRWVTITENNRNKSNTIRLSYDGIGLTLKEISEKFHLKYGTVRKRYRIGWSVERIINEPLRVWPS